MQQFDIIAKTFQGLEGILAEELTALGANNIAIGRRVVSYTGDKELLYRSNFCLRTAIKILKPIKHFQASSADEVYAEVMKLDWSQYLTPDTTFAVDSVVYSNDFRHSKFVAYKVKDAIADQFAEREGRRPSVRVTNPDIQLHIHIAERDCTLCLDSSGESLHRRGYRTEGGPAPLNEVLAAGMIMMTGWRGECDFIDPMCGSGTLPIEAALIARNIAPGVYRQGYAFERWPDFDAELLERIYNDDSAEREFHGKVYGYDISREAVITSLRNVRAASLMDCVEIAQADFAQFKQPARPALMMMNPPYGERISSPDLTGLYRTIGERLKHQFVDNDAWVLSYREECFEAIGLRPSVRIPLYNGALECELRKYRIFGGKIEDARQAGTVIKTDRERREMSQRKFSSSRRADEQTGRREGENLSKQWSQTGRREDRQARDDAWARRKRDDRKYSGDRRQRQDERKRAFGGKRDFKDYKGKRYDRED